MLTICVVTANILRQALRLFTWQLSAASARVNMFVCALNDMALNKLPSTARFESWHSTNTNTIVNLILRSALFGSYSYLGNYQPAH